MKTKTLHMPKFLFAMALTIFLGASMASAVMAADQQLDALHAGSDVTCDDCHAGSDQRDAVPMIKCLECHDTAALAEETADLKPTNPHKNRHYSTETDCNLCHHQHEKSENFCLPCHVRFDFKVP